MKADRERQAEPTEERTWKQELNEVSAHAAVLPVSPLLLRRLFSFTSLSVTTVPFSPRCIRKFKARVPSVYARTLINYYFAALR